MDPKLRSYETSFRCPPHTRSHERAKRRGPNTDARARTLGLPAKTTRGLKNTEHFAVGKRAAAADMVFMRAPCVG